MQQTADRALALFIALILALVLAFYSYKAKSEIQYNGANNIFGGTDGLQKGQKVQSWVDQLQNKQGAICCTNNDGRRLDDPDWDTLGKAVEDHNGNSGFRVYEDGKWNDVPNWAIVVQPNLDGIPRVWWGRQYYSGGNTVKQIMCFLKGLLG